MPWAITDVENPADQALSKALAPAGATSGLICRYASDNVIHFPPGANTDVDTPPAAAGAEPAGVGHADAGTSRDVVDCRCGCQHRATHWYL